MQFIIHPPELTQRWIDLAKKLKIQRISLHPEGGMSAHESLEKMLTTLQDPEFRAKIDQLWDSGIEFGYEFHALSYLLPRDLFATHPEYFRMNDQGERVTKGNFCFSNREARKIICDNAVKLAEQLYRSCDEYYFWLDDATKLTCHCEECKKHNFAYHQLTLMNEEYAPFERYTKPDQFSFDEPYLQLVKDIVKFFGKKDAKVLEYWYDNSIYYRRAGKKLVPFTPNNEQIKKDLVFYRELGFEQMSCFACSLCDEYVSLFGDPDFSALE